MTVKRTELEWFKILDQLTCGHIPLVGRRSLYDNGQRLIQWLLRHNLLNDVRRIVDLGCGNGRLAMGLCDAKVTYLGLDCVAESIRWCQQAFEPWPHIEFSHIDVRNSLYNSTGTVAPDEVHFPIDDNTVDLVVCWSLFTHIENETFAAHQLDEISRILCPGGKAVITWFRSPPHEVERSAAKTVFTDSQLRGLISHLTLIEELGGHRADNRDHWITILQKP